MKEYHSSRNSNKKENEGKVRKRDRNKREIITTWLLHPHRPCLRLTIVVYSGEGSKAEIFKRVSPKGCFLSR